MLAPTRPQGELIPPLRFGDGSPRRVGPSRWQRIRRVALGAAVICAVPALVSYVQAITARSDSSLGIRTVEWLRDHGARGLVNDVENIYYTLNAPAKGGPALHSLPAQAGVALVPPSVRSHRRIHFYRPGAIAPIIRPVLAGEGTWHATYAHGGNRPPVLVTSFRTDPSYPRLVAGVAWIDHTQTSTWLYPGISEPAVNLPSRGPEEVPAELRPKLVATFNSGFKMKDELGGVAIGGHTYKPLVHDLGTFVRYRNGRIDVTAWQGGPSAGPDVVYARQNLPLIVNHGRANPNLSDSQEWGFTLGNAVRVWRSAVGVDARGNLVYAAAPDQTVGSLAAIMIHAGAVRAMELDINTYWTTFISYRHPAPGTIGAANLLSNMSRPSSRYLAPDDRDFFAVYLR
jgi:Phosphodiester glycosidase